MAVGLRNTRDGMVHREAPPKRPQRTKIGLCASNGSSAPLREAARRFVRVNSRYHDNMRWNSSRGLKVCLLLYGGAVESGRRRGGDGPRRDPELLE
jgi:hypothetical protein